MAALRQSTRIKREAPSRGAAPQARLRKNSQDVPSLTESEKSTPSSSKTVHTCKSGTRRADNATTRTSARFSTPTATDLATIPTSHTTPNSAPLQALEANSPRVEILAVLTKMMGNRLSPEKLANYQVMILNLVRRGAKEVAIRRRYHPALIDFFKHHPQTMPVHNKFAKVYNKQFEGQHERFHLPVFDETDAVRAMEEKKSVKVEKTIGRQTRNRRTKVNRDSYFTSDMVYPPQMDGAMDIDPSDGSYDPAPSTSTPPNDTPPSSNISERDEFIAEQVTDTSDGLEMLDVSQTALSLEATSTELEPATRSETFEESRADGAPTANGGSPPQAQEPTLAEQTTLTHTVVQASLGNAQGIMEAPILPAPANSWPDEPGAQKVDVDMIDSPTSMTEAGHIGNESGDLSVSVASSSTPSPNPHFLAPATARSYLAWLHHRQERFPTAAPRYAEFVIIAQKLGRAPARVFDDAMYHWGFETGDRAKWYKQNRLELLGEDPRFDEEKMGKFGAWMKVGRDEKERKEMMRRERKGSADG